MMFEVPLSLDIVQIYFCACRENLKNMPDQISEHVGRKDYMAAAQLVVQAQENLQGPLLNIEGLKEVRNDLAAKQEV